MAIDLGLWLYDTEAIPTTNRAAAAWNRINDKPLSVAFKMPNGTVLSAQTVRIEFDNTVSQSEDASGKTAVRKLVIFGVRGHGTVADTAVGEGYRFVYQNAEYKVVDVITTIGEIQAIAEAVG